MYIGLTLDALDIDLWDIVLLETDLNLLDTDIPSKYFVYSKGVLNTSSSHVLKPSSRRLQGNNFSSSKTSSRHFTRCFQDVFKTWSWKIKKMLQWKRVGDVFKANKCLLGSVLVIHYFIKDIVFCTNVYPIMILNLA